MKLEQLTKRHAGTRELHGVIAFDVILATPIAGLGEERSRCYGR